MECKCAMSKLDDAGVSWINRYIMECKYLAGKYAGY